jgi:hypothetical protein
VHAWLVEASNAYSPFSTASSKRAVRQAQSSGTARPPLFFFTASSMSMTQACHAPCYLPRMITCRRRIKTSLQWQSRCVNLNYSALPVLAHQAYSTCNGSSLPITMCALRDSCRASRSHSAKRLGHIRGLNQEMLIPKQRHPVLQAGSTHWHSNAGKDGQHIRTSSLRILELGK